ncbi:MAG: hypothetical protein JSR91_09695 [Proteobacteria bacterium]|nr:hypothetical protein [Pseudomonadota bacterium]
MPTRSPSPIPSGGDHIRAALFRSGGGGTPARIALTDLTDHRPIVFGLPRCGVPMAHEIARHLRAPLDVAPVRTVRAPDDRRRLVAIIPVGHTPRCPSSETGIKRRHLARLARNGGARPWPRSLPRRRYRGTGGMISPSGRLAIVVDQAIGPGHAMAGAIRLLRGAGASEIVIATPVASRAGLQRFADLATRTICLRQENDLASLDRYHGEATRIGHRPGQPPPESAMGKRSPGAPNRPIPTNNHSAMAELLTMVLARADA